jgi:hypothetical protein
VLCCLRQSAEGRPPSSRVCACHQRQDSMRHGSRGHAGVPTAFLLGPRLGHAEATNSFTAGICEPRCSTPRCARDSSARHFVHRSRSICSDIGRLCCTQLRPLRCAESRSAKQSYHHGFSRRDSPAPSCYATETTHASSWANCDALSQAFLMLSAPVLPMPCSFRSLRFCPSLRLHFISVYLILAFVR